MIYRDRRPTADIMKGTPRTTSNGPARAAAQRTAAAAVTLPTSKEPPCRTSSGAGHPIGPDAETDAIRQ
jgi:hypothetical protein